MLNERFSYCCLIFYSSFFVTRNHTYLYFQSPEQSDRCKKHWKHLLCIYHEPFSNSNYHSQTHILCVHCVRCSCVCACHWSHARRFWNLIINFHQFAEFDANAKNKWIYVHTIGYNAGAKNVGKLFDFHSDVECGNQICMELQIFTTMYDLKPVRQAVSYNFVMNIES